MFKEKQLIWFVLFVFTGQSNKGPAVITTVYALSDIFQMLPRRYNNGIAHDSFARLNNKTILNCISIKIEELFPHSLCNIDVR